MRRTQLWIDEGQHERLSQRAEAEGVTVSSLIRDAVERFLVVDTDASTALERFRTAVGAAAGSAPQLPSGREYVERLRANDERRQAELDEQRTR